MNLILRLRRKSPTAPGSWRYLIRYLSRSHSLDIQEILEDALNKTVEQMGFEAGQPSAAKQDRRPHT